MMLTSGLLSSLNCLNDTTCFFFQGFAIPKDQQKKVAKFKFEGKPAEMRHGSVVIAAITSCTNTSNPSVMLGAGLVAKKATELGLEVSLVSILLSLACAANLLVSGCFRSLSTI